MGIEMKIAAIKIFQLRPELAKLMRCVSGATAVEYGLLAGLVAVGIAGGIGALAELVNAIFEMLGENTTAVADNIDAS